MRSFNQILRESKYDILYHGSETVIHKITKKDGLWFTPDINYAKNFGNFIYKCNVEANLFDIKNDSHRKLFKDWYSEEYKKYLEKKKFSYDRVGRYNSLDELLNEISEEAIKHWLEQDLSRLNNMGAYYVHSPRIFRRDIIKWLQPNFDGLIQKERPGTLSEKKPLVETVLIFKNNLNVIKDFEPI